MNDEHHDQPNMNPEMPQTPPSEVTQPETPPDKDERVMGMLCHLLGIFSSFIGPLIIWTIKKDESPFVNKEGKESVNFQLTALIAYAVCAIFSCLIFPIFVASVIWILVAVFCIIGSIKASDGNHYRYPLAIRFIR